MAVPACCGCGKVVADGLKFNDFLICAACESELLSSQADQYDYEYWISVCHKLWIRLLKNR